MRVHHVFATAGKIALGCLVVLACAALATVGTYLGLGLSRISLRSPIPSPEATLVSPATAPADDDAPTATPAEILAARFPEAEAAAVPRSTSFFASVIPGDGGEPFDLNAVSGVAGTEPPWPSVDGVAPAAGAAEEPEPARQSDPVKPEPPKAPAAGAPPRRTTARSPNVLNDAMIASIRQRLKLTAEQQKMWPAVEAALRKIVYTRAAFNPQGRGQPGGATAYIDPASAEVQELKSAALPLIMRLNDEQKREVRMLAYVMGLEAVASQF